MGYAQFLTPRKEVITDEGVESIIDLANIKDETGKRLEARPSEFLDRRIIEVQVVCRGKLRMGHRFWLEYRKEELPLDAIFGLPAKKTIRQDIPVFETGFNLSS